MWWKEGAKRQYFSRDNTIYTTALKIHYSWIWSSDKSKSCWTGSANLQLLSSRFFQKAWISGHYWGNIRGLNLCKLVHLDFSHLKTFLGYLGAGRMPQNLWFTYEHLGYIVIRSENPHKLTPLSPQGSSNVLLSEITAAVSKGKQLQKYCPTQIVNQNISVLPERLHYISKHLHFFCR